MDAIAGIYDPDAESVAIEADLTRMRRALELPSPQSRVQSAAAQGAGCVVLDHRGSSGGPSVVRDRTRRIWLAFAGEIYTSGDLLARLRESGHGEEDASLCLRLYLRDGAGFVSTLNGHFTLVIHDEAERRLLLATDRFGYRPLFLAARGRRLLFASEMKAILAALDTTPAPDGIGLLELARHGWPLGDRTWLEPIRLADPGSSYTVTPSGTTRQRHFRFRFERSAGTSSLAAYVDGLAEKLRQAMQRATALPGRIGLPLSGGLDSRALLLAAAGRVPFTFTFGEADTRDARGAAELARIAGVEHQQLPYEPGYLGRLLLPIVWRTEGLLPFASVTFTSMHFHASLARRADVLVYGHGGDALTGAHLPTGILLWRSKEKLIERIFRQCRPADEAALKSVFHPRFHARFAPDLYEALRATFTGIEAEEIADMHGVWDIENRQRRGIFASGTVDRCRFAVRAPFLEHDLVDHLRSAWPSWRLHQRGYKQMLATAFPSAAHVPWAHTGTRPRSGLLGDLAALARGNVRRRLGRALSAPEAWTDPRTFRDLGAHTRADARLAQSILEFAASPNFPAEVFDARGIEQVVRRHWDGRQDLTHLVSMLATFAAAYRLLLWQRPSAIPEEALPAG